MNRRLLPVLVSALNLACLAARAAPLGTAFTYQGRLTDGANAANGFYDLRFAIYEAASGPNLAAGPVTNGPVGVTNGLFTVTLDSGAGIFAGGARLLEIGVRTNGSPTDFATLAPRQPITPSPYALYAPSAGSAAHAGSPALTTWNPPGAR